MTALSRVWLDTGLFMHVCSATCALQCLIQHYRGEESRKGCCGCILFPKLNIFTWTSSNCTTKPFYTQWERMFSSFLVRNSFICCSFQNSLSTDHGFWPHSPFPLPYCLLAFPSLNDVRTFCAYLNSQMSAWSTAPVSWDVLTVSLTALEFYSPSILAHTPPENNQQKAEDHLEMR